MTSVPYVRKQVVPIFYIVGILSFYKSVNCLSAYHLASLCGNFYLKSADVRNNIANWQFVCPSVYVCDCLSFCLSRWLAGSLSNAIFSEIYHVNKWSITWQVSFSSYLNVYWYKGFVWLLTNVYYDVLGVWSSLSIRWSYFIKIIKIVRPI